MYKTQPDFVSFVG